MQDYHGVTLAAKDFCVKLNSYDGTNAYNPNTMDAKVSLQNFNLWVIYRDENTGLINYSPFVQQLESLDSASVISIPEEFKTES